MIELRILQQYLELAMWKTNSEVGRDTCGKYPRCAYCIRTQEFACAKAFLSCMQAGRDGNVPKGGFPEPPAKEFFGDELIEKRPLTSFAEGAKTVYSMNSMYGQLATSMLFSDAFAEVRASDSKQTARQITAGKSETYAAKMQTGRRVAGERVLNVRSGFEGERTSVATIKRKQRAE